MFYLPNDSFIRILLLILIFLVVSQLSKIIFKNKYIPFVIGFCVSLISVGYLSYSQLDFLSKTSSGLGTILLITIPFLIVFLFIYTSGFEGVLRKMFWVFYGIMAFLIFQNRSTFSSEATTNISMLIIIIAITMLFLDKTIKNQFVISKNLRR